MKEQGKWDLMLKDTIGFFFEVVIAWNLHTGMWCSDDGWLRMLFTNDEGQPWVPASLYLKCHRHDRMRREIFPKLCN